MGRSGAVVAGVGRTTLREVDARAGDSLKAARRRRGLSRSRLAALSGLSADTIYSYEAGRRRPAPAVSALLYRVLLEPSGGNTAPLHPTHRPDASAEDASWPSENPALAWLAADLADCAWPCLVLNARHEVEAWNLPAARVFGIEPEHRALPAHQRNLLWLLTTQWLRDRLANWADLVTYLVTALDQSRAAFVRTPSGEAYHRRLAGTLERELPAVLPSLLATIHAGRARDGGARDGARLLLQADGGPALAFACRVSPWPEMGGAWVLDCHPITAESLSWLGSGCAAPETVDTPLVGAMLYEARQARDLELVDLERSLSGISEGALRRYEAGERRPARSALLRVARALDLEPAATNVLLRRAGHALMPSRWERAFTGAMGRSPARDVARWRARAARTQQARALIAERDWPCLVMDERGLAVAANGTLQRLLGAEAGGEDVVAGAIHLVDLLDQRDVRTHTLNREEMVRGLNPSGAHVGRVGARRGGAGDAPVSGGGGRRRAATGRRQRAEGGASSGLRPHAPVVWRSEGGATLDFRCVVTSWAHTDGWWVLDWYPMNAAACEWLAETGAGADCGGWSAAGSADAEVHPTQW